MSIRNTSLRVVPRTSTGQPDLSIAAATGASASVEQDAIVVRDAQGAVVFRFDSCTGVATLVSPGSELRLSAPHGKLVLEAGTDIELRAGGSTRLLSRDLTAAVDTANLQVEKLQVTSTDADIVVDRWRLKADRILEKAGDVYRDIDGLLQTHADRLRAVVRGATQILSGRTLIVREKETAIDGEKVLLG